jgi:nucleotide-binding universal stress UspA family protein
VLDAAPCEVAILHGDLNPRSVKNVLIPFGENIHTRLAFEIAPAIVDHFKCEVEATVVLNSDTPPEQHGKRVKEIQQRLKSGGLPAHIHITRNNEIIKGVVQRSKSADLVIMGGRSGDFLGLLFGQSLTQEITEHAACPVLWVNEYEERPPFWKGLFASVEKKEVEEHHG